MRARNHHVFAERAMLALGLVMLGGYTGWSLHADRVRIEDRERQRLTDQVRTVDDNLERQLGAINFALKGLQRDLPVLLGRHGGVADLRLATMVGSMTGARTLFVLDGQGRVPCSSSTWKAAERNPYSRAGPLPRRDCACWPCVQADMQPWPWTHPW
jgi:hypothetical protein